MHRAECHDCSWACADSDDDFVEMEADKHEFNEGHMVVVKDLRRYG